MRWVNVPSRPRPGDAGGFSVATGADATGTACAIEHRGPAAGARKVFRSVIPGSISSAAHRPSTTLLDVLGSGIRTTQWFRAPTAWKIAGWYDCTAYGTKGNFMQPVEHLWPLTNEPLANQRFPDLATLEEIQAQRCLALQQQLELIRQDTLFHWWPTDA
jgi:hypothetical protein